MTPTGEERRKVADDLRARAFGVGFAYYDVYALNDGWVYLTLCEIVEAIGCAEDPHPARWMFRLADLIDPEGDTDGTDWRRAPRGGGKAAQDAGNLCVRGSAWHQR